MILHRYNTKHALYASVEEIIEIIDRDYDHHKGYTEYQIRYIKHSSPAYDGYTLWVRESELVDFKELPKNHPAWLLYGTK
jgi:hypothetical protein